MKSETWLACFGSHVLNDDYQWSVANHNNGSPAPLKLDTGPLYAVGCGGLWTTL